MPHQWPAQLYDYARGVIVDDQVAALDFEEGKWVRCLCCDKVLRAVSFSVQGWIQHKQTRIHQRARRCTRELTVEASPEYEAFASAMNKCLQKDTNYLIFNRKELEKRAKSEVQNKELAHKMALLLADQQEDIEALRNEVDDLKELVDELHEIMEHEREAKGDQHEDSSRKRRLRDSENSLSPRRVIKRNRDEQEDEIDMFDDEVQSM